MDFNKRIVLRADGSSVIGYGHVFRLIALAEILGPHFKCSFASQEIPDFVSQSLNQLNVSTLTVPPFKYSHPDLKTVEDEIPFDLDEHLDGGEIVVTDGYWFGVNYQRSVKAKGSMLVCVDDLADIEFVGDVVLNHAPRAGSLQYKSLPSTKLCLGLDYLLLRRSFLEFASKHEGRSKLKEKISKVGICLGGSCHPDTINQIVNCLAEVADVKGITVVGTNCLMSNIKKEIAFMNGLNSDELISFFLQCDLLICTPSTICLEACCIGIPIITILMADNQKLISDGLSELGAIRTIDMRELDRVDDIFAAIDFHTREAMVSNQSKIFNGESLRIIQKLFASI